MHADTTTRTYLCPWKAGKKFYPPKQAIYRLKETQTRMWANAQPDGRLAEHRWRPLFNAAKFG